MSQAITISRQDILHQVKLSCQIPAIIEQIVTRKILVDTATSAGIKVEPEELQQAADNIRLISKLKTADETWAWLQKNVYTNIISSKLAQHLFADKVEPWFVERQLDYAGAVMYEVVLDDEDLAMELFYTLQEGEMSFPEVAHQQPKSKQRHRLKLHLVRLTRNRTARLHLIALSRSKLKLLLNLNLNSPQKSLASHLTLQSSFFRWKKIN